MNAYGVATYLRDKEYAQIINNADLIYADGWGPVWASFLSKDKLSCRVNVGDYMPSFLYLCQKNNFSIFF